MSQFTLANWPLWFVCVAMVVAAVIDGWKLKVPNWLTFPLVISGWLYGLTLDFGFFGAPGAGGLGGALAGTALGFILLFPVYAIGGMGAGDVKMQMGFGSWVGAFFGLWPGLVTIFWAFCLAVVIGGIIAVCMMAVRRQFRANLDNTRAILGDLIKAPSVGEIAGRAAQRKPRMHLLPYGIPLCIGFVGYLIFM